MGFNINSKYSAEKQAEMERSDATLVGEKATPENGAGLDVVDILTDKAGGVNG
jgi:hypothetical protein